MYIASEKDLRRIFAVKDTITGKGVFALKDIPEKTILMHVKGNPMNFSATKLLGEYEAYTIQIAKDQYLLTEPPFRFVNHCCNPNTALDADLFLYTIKDIKAGDQICWDYSTSMLERSWTMECTCGDKNCRKKIEDFDLLPQEIQKKYISMGIVLPFILRQLRKIV